MVPALLIRRIQAFFSQRQVDQEMVPLRTFGRQPLGEKINLTPQPQLTVLLLRVVGQQPKRWCLRLLQVFVESHEQTLELPLWVEPEANPRPLFVRESLLDLGDEDGKNHGALLGPPAPLGGEGGNVPLIPRHTISLRRLLIN